MESKRVIALLTVCILSILIVSGTVEVSATVPPPSSIKNGPYVDNILYTEISNPSERVLALQAGTIEMDTNYFDSVYYDQLNADPDIDIHSSVRNGYGHITINCRDYPLNISGLRRAFAYAFDKTEVRTDIFDGYGIDHDSLVPDPNEFCIEDDFNWNYYTPEVAIGNAILNDLNFAIDGGTGFRLAPNGSAFDIEIEYSSSSSIIGGGIAQIAVDALTALHIDATAVPADFNDYIVRLDNHGDYDMIFYSQNFYSTDVDWLAYEYWGDYADVDYMNPCNFVNDSYDLLRDQLLDSIAYEDVYDAAAQMQEILHYNVPRLVVYENTYLQGYRNDQYTGHVPDLGRSISGPWTMRNIRNLDGTLGGEVPVAIENGPYSFNFFATSTSSGAAINSNLYSSLYSYGPDLQPLPDLAVNMLTETHSDNAAVPTGHTRYTIDIVQNATWTDGMPLTADDVANTFNYYFDSAPFGNPAGTDIGDLVAAYTTSTYTAVLEFNSESYWTFSNFAFDIIIPEHIFNDATGIAPSAWASWSAPQPSSGPFYVSEYSYGNWYRLARNPFYYYPAPNPAPLVSEVADFSYVVGTTGNEIVWEVSDDNPLTYVVMKDLNLTPYASGLWDGTDITVNIDGLSLGTYTFTLGLLDYSGNFVSDSVIVTVVAEGTSTGSTSGSTTTNTTGGTDGEPFELDNLTILIAVGSIGAIAVVVILIWKSKQS